MPKRKAPEGASAITPAPDGSANSKSPNPHKKSKKESLAAAKLWHDKRLKSGVVHDVAAPSRSNKATAQPTTAQTSAASNSNKVATVQPTFSSQSSLLGEAKSPKRNGGNTFLQSLRKGTISSAHMKEETTSISDKSSVTSPTNGEISSSNNTSAENDSNANNNGLKRGIGFVEIIILLIFSALNVTTAIYIYGEQSFHNNFQKLHVLEVEALKEELSKSRDVEAVLQSGIDILEQAQMKWPLKDLGEVPALYNIQIADQRDRIQSSEENAEWLEGVRLLEVGKHLALDDLDLKLVGFGVEGGKEKMRVIKEG